MAFSSGAAFAALRVVSTVTKPSRANFWAMAPPTPQRTPTGTSRSSTALPCGSLVVRPSACHLDVAPTTTATGRVFALMAGSIARLCAAGNREIMTPAARARRRRAGEESPRDVGLQMVFASYGWTDVSDAQVWDEELRLARLAADLGFDVLWSVEHHFNDYSFC